MAEYDQQTVILDDESIAKVASRNSWNETISLWTRNGHQVDHGHDDKHEYKSFKSEDNGKPYSARGTGDGAIGDCITWSKVEK